MTVVGIRGFAHAGKDTVADVLTQEFGFTRIGIADAIRESLLALNPDVVCTSGDRGLRTGVWPLQKLVELEGWEAAKQYAAVRSLLQRYGGEATKPVFGKRVWLKVLFKRAAGVDRLVIPDIRYPEDLAAVRKRGGWIILVERPGVGPVNDHISERILAEDCDFAIENNGTLTQLRVMAREIAKTVLARD